MAVSIALLSMAEFARLPQPGSGLRQELHHGEVVELPPVKKIHTKLQKTLVTLLESALRASRSATDYVVDKEFPFRPLPEYEVWVADVAVFSRMVWEQTPDDEYFHGVPDLVIEVLSPSNTASEMLDREEICLSNGGREFWLVDPQRNAVRVMRAGGSWSVHDIPGRLESVVLGRSIAVRDIFGLCENP